MNEERARRIGMNEAVFREVNERITDVAESFGLEQRALDLICECGDAACTAQFQMTHAEYEQIRSDPHLFAVYPGHEMPDVEEVVETRGAYDIVRKFEGQPAAVAEKTDPRS